MWLVGMYPRKTHNRQHKGQGIRANLGLRRTGQLVGQAGRVGHRINIGLHLCTPIHRNNMVPHLWLRAYIDCNQQPHNVRIALGTHCTWFLLGNHAKVYRNNILDTKVPL